jgi:hypothetical protein
VRGPLAPQGPRPSASDWAARPWGDSGLPGLQNREAGAKGLAVPGDQVQYRRPKGSPSVAGEADEDDPLTLRRSRGSHRPGSAQPTAIPPAGARSGHGRPSRRRSAARPGCPRA